MNAPLPDWRSDWLYALILRKAEDEWRHCIHRVGRDEWQYVLVQERSPVIPDSVRGGGGAVRGWVRDADGLREITLDELGRHKSLIQDRLYPFVMLDFFIYPDRERVYLGCRMAYTAGHGGRHLVQGEGDEAKLVPDPTGGMWIS